MYIIHNERNNTSISMPETIFRSQSSILEVGHSFPPPGYHTKKNYRQVHVLHYLVSGRVTYYGKTMDAPCMFLLVPHEPHFYQIDDSPNIPPCEQYWIIAKGPDIPNVLMNANLPNDPVLLPCPYIYNAKEILQELQNPENYKNQNEFFYLFAGFFRLLSLHAASSQQSKYNRTHNRVQTICDYIHKNHAHISSEKDLASAFNYSTSYLHKIFKEEMGVPPIRYLINYRIQRAKQLLKNSDLPIYQISELVGFNSANYFCLSFQKICGGISPRDYRKKHLSN